ncbi:hypothetical protein C8R48DRAFT_679203 [Suillus tomentosus]|nr:hypothetical protein C8R48DRAFT_679203 [Suillus tomentosus]
MSYFIYDTKRVSWEAIGHPRAGFGIASIFGVALKARLEFLLDHFLPPHSALLPIDQNGLAWFLRTKLAKALVWHVVFRVTRSTGIRLDLIPGVPLIVADLEPDTFRNGPSLPCHTLAFVKSFCYGALVRLLNEVVERLPNATLNRVYPSPREVHNQAIQTIGMLLQQYNDPGLASFQNHMLHLCNLAVDDVERVVRHLADYKAMADDGHQTLKNYKNGRSQPVIPRSLRSPVTNYLQLDTMKMFWHLGFNNVAPKSSLSDSLLVTAAVLFGLVDSHDLTGLLDVILEEVKMQISLQQEEEENCSVFLQRGGRCFMEQRMYRAQIEVSLFSKAIANLCEELNARSQPVSWRFEPNLTLLAVNAVGYACPPPSSLNFKCFGPAKATEKAATDKCHAWLLASSKSQDTRQIASNASAPLHSPCLQESLLKRDDQLFSLPRSMKSWVDNSTYRTYMSASSAETNEPLRIDNNQRFIRKEYKSPDALMSILHILDLKTQRAQAEADMFFEAIERTAEIESTDDGGLAALFQFPLSLLIRNWAAITFIIVPVFHEIRINRLLVTSEDHTPDALPETCEPPVHENSSRPRCRIKETIQKSAKGVTKKLSKPFKCFRNRTPANQNANLRDALTTVVQNPETEGASSSQKNEHLTAAQISSDPANQGLPGEPASQVQATPSGQEEGPGTQSAGAVLQGACDSVESTGETCDFCGIRRRQCLRDLAAAADFEKTYLQPLKIIDGVLDKIADV